MAVTLFHHKLSLTQLLGTAAVAWTVQYLLARWISAKRIARGIASCPPEGAVVLINPFRTLAIAVGSFYPFKGQMGWYFARFSLYKRYGSSCLASTNFWDAQPTYWVADAEAVKAITSDRFAFTKDVEAYETLNFYGPNIVGTEGSEWKRHRDIARSAFNEANNALAWRETTRIVNEWFSEIDAAATSGSRSTSPAPTSKQQPTTQINLLRDLTRATLLIIGSAGFGRHSTWSEDINSTPPPGHRVAFSPAVVNVVDSLIPRILIPKFVWNAVTKGGVYLPLVGPMVSRARDAFDDLRGHMLDVASQARDRFGVSRQSAIEDGSDSIHGAALLRNMVAANMSFEKDEGRGGHKSLTDGELFSDMFLFFLAGHETTAHTLCFAFIYLALHPEHQQRVFEEALKVYPEGVPCVAPPSAYKDFLPQLEFTWAVLHESLRLRPPVARLGKIVQSDTSIKSHRFTTSLGGKTTVTQKVDVPVQKGSLCVLDIFGLHNNLHWGDDVETFRPERFIDTETYKWPRDAFLAFSGGPRSCIGQRFAITESVCMIASIVRRYEILLPGDMLGLSPEEQKRRLAQWKPGVTIIPTNPRVRFRRREA